jgi:PAS domain S-box-containing protein
MIAGGVIAFFIPFVIGGIITYAKVSGSVEFLAEEKLVQIAKDMSKIIQLILVQELKIVSAIASDPQVVEVSAGNNYRKIYNKLTAIGNRLGRDYDDFILIDKKGIVRSVSIDPKRIGIVLTDREYFKKAMNGEPSVSEPVVSRATGDLIVVACAPVFGADGKITGAAAGIIRIDFLINNISSIKIGNTGYLFMVNSSGTAIVHPDRNLILKTNMKDFPELSGLREKMLSGQTGAKYYIFKGIKKTAGFAPVEITGWSIAVTQDRNEIMVPVKSLLNFLVVSSICFLFTGIAAIYFISRKISIPVEKSLEIFNQIVFHASEIVIYIGVNRKIWQVNNAVERLTGYSQHEMIGKEPVFDNINNVPAENIWRTLNEGRTWSGRIIIPSKHGENLTIETIVFPVLTEKGRIYSFVQIGRDVTKEIISENRLREAQKMEAIGVLAGGIAHDFNNILSGIFGYAEISLINLYSTEKVQKNIQEILNASARARDLVNQILAFSRKTEIDLKPVIPKDIIREALKFLRASIPSSIEIHDLINSDSLIMGDPSQLHQVIVNICTNAAYSIGNSYGVIAVALEDFNVDDDFVLKHTDLNPGMHIMLKISDSGHGMDARIMEHIFDPFFTTKPAGEGTGLGLSVVHGIVKKFKGAITVYSEVDKGTVFNIMIPVITSGGIEPLIRSEENIQGGTERILFVDDEAMIIDSMQTIMQNLGYRVISFIDCRIALKRFMDRPEDFDVIITDYTMPYMTGIELAGLIKKVRDDIPVILSSGYINVNLEKTAAEAGITHLLKKPVTTSELAELLRKVLDNKNKFSWRDR